MTTEYIEYEYSNSLMCGAYASDNLYYVMHEFLSQCKYEGINKIIQNNPIINILLKNDSRKRYDIVIDSLKPTHDLLLISSTGTTFDLKLKNCGLSIYKYFGLRHTITNVNLYEHSILGILRDLKFESTNKHVYVVPDVAQISKQQNQTNPIKPQNFSQELSQTLRDISEISKNINTVPTIDKIKLDKSSCDSDSEESTASDDSLDTIQKRLKQRNKCMQRKTSTSSCSECSSYNDSELNMIEDEINNLEIVKQNINNKVDELKTSISDEKQNLSNYLCVANANEYDLKMEKERKREEYNIFVSEKEFTYPRIYNLFFVKKVIKTWDCVPPLFMVKFPVYLYLDGKNTKGETVRDRILGTDEEFDMYKILYDSITDDEFELPEDERIAKIVEDFVETLPPIQIVTARDLLESLNDENDPLFEEDETSQCSGDDKDDKDYKDREGGNSAYNIMRH